VSVVADGANGHGTKVSVVADGANGRGTKWKKVR